MGSPLDLQTSKISGVSSDAVNALLWFGTAMMRAGNTASRTREWMRLVAGKLGFDEIAVGLTLDTVTVAVRRDQTAYTAIREIGSIALSGSRIAELERLAMTLGHELAAEQITARLAQIESSPPHYPIWQVAPAIGVASSGFAFLNGSAVLEMLLAGIGGAIGQWFRSLLNRRQFNPFIIPALCAISASGSYVLLSVLARHAGLGSAVHPAGFIASVLFLVPGFPLIAALFDLLQQQSAAAIARFAHGLLMLLTIAAGLSLVVVIANVDLTPQPSFEVSYPLTLILRAAASFLAGCAFAMLFNNTGPAVLAGGLVALSANELRLILYDFGMSLAPAAFFGTLTVGLMALVVQRWFGIPRIAIAVPATIIMVPGLYAYEAIVLLNRGQILEGLQAVTLCGFIIGALALGLLSALMFSRSDGEPGG